MRSAKMIPEKFRRKEKYVMKRFFGVLLLLLLAQIAFADEIVNTDAEQIIEMSENKVILNIQKQPLNEQSKQKIVLKKNWFVVNINVNGKVKVNPLANSYELE